MKRSKELWIAAILLVFTLITIVRHLTSYGADLSSSYYASRLLATHQPDHIYSRDPVNYDAVADPVWSRLGKATGIHDDKQLHPYVQAPLWAYILKPACMHMQFPAFNLMFLMLISFLISATIWIVARVWTPGLFTPGWIALICAALYLSEAYKYAMVLTQTHIIFVVMTLIALVCAQRRHSLWAGGLLAGAAAVKVTPALLIFYWLAKKQWRASLSFLLFSALLGIASILTTGLALNLVYLKNLSAISNILLVSYNNQSLAAFLMARYYPLTELHSFHSLHLPSAIKTSSTLLSIAFTVLGGFLDRRAEKLKPGAPPFGAALALLAATIFAPIAWTHYYLILIFPLLLLTDAIRRQKSFLLLASILLIFALNFDFQTLGGVLKKYELFPIVRSQFYSGVVCMAALLYASLRKQEAGTLSSSAGSSVRENATASAGSMVHAQ